MMQFIKDSLLHSSNNRLRLRFRHSTSILVLIGMLWFLAVPGRLSGGSNTALAAGDPVIAAAGDIACDPSASSFKSGNGTASKCRQKYTSDLLVNANLAGVLMLGDS